MFGFFGFESLVSNLRFGSLVFEIFSVLSHVPPRPVTCPPRVLSHVAAAFCHMPPRVLHMCSDFQPEVKLNWKKLSEVKLSYVELGSVTLS